MRSLLILGVVIALASGLEAPQRTTAQTSATTFEVASVEYSQTSDVEYSIGVDLRRSRFRAINASLESLLIWAYGIAPIQIVGRPDWITSERFNVEGQAQVTGSQYSRNDILRMVQPLLEDRFKLRFHREDAAFVIDHVELPPD